MTEDSAAFEDKNWFVVIPMAVITLFFFLVAVVDVTIYMSLTKHLIPNWLIIIFCLSPFLVYPINASKNGVKNGLIHAFYFLSVFFMVPLGGWIKEEHISKTTVEICDLLLTSPGDLFFAGLLLLPYGLILWGSGTYFIPKKIGQQNGEHAWIPLQVGIGLSFILFFIAFAMFGAIAHGCQGSN